MKQTILGSGGAIGIPLARELKKYTGKVRFVSRNPRKVNETDELFPIDLSHIMREVIDACKNHDARLVFFDNIYVYPPTAVPFMTEDSPIMKEFPEMMYQFEEDYILDSSKFEKRFGLKATSPKEGIKQMMECLTA